MNKKEKLLRTVKDKQLTTNPKRLQSNNEKVGYRIVPASLYTPEADWLDHTVAELKQAGLLKANRSLIIRESIHLLQARFKGKSSEEKAQLIIENNKV